MHMIGCVNWSCIISIQNILCQNWFMHSYLESSTDTYQLFKLIFSFSWYVEYRVE